MSDANTDENTAQPIYKLSVPMFLEKSCPMGLSLDGVTKKVSVCHMFPFVSFSMWRAIS